MTTNPLSPTINPSRANIKAPQKAIHFSSKISLPNACVPTLDVTGVTGWLGLVTLMLGLCSPRPRSGHSMELHTLFSEPQTPATTSPGTHRQHQHQTDQGRGGEETYDGKLDKNCIIILTAISCSQQSYAYSFILLMAYFDFERREESLVVCKSAG